MKNLENALASTLVSQNASLSARVTQLESENTDLRIRHAGFEKYFSAHSAEIYRRHRSSIYRLQCDTISAPELGDVQVRRDLYLGLISKLENCGRLTELHPHNGMGERLRVLMLGSGGIGDCLTLTYDAALLRSYLPIDYLAVAFEGKQVHEIFANSGLAETVLDVKHEGRDQLFSICSSLDVFDLIIDVRYSAIAFFPPLSRVSPPLRELITRSGEQWYRYNAFDWPHLNHALANQAMAMGLNAYSMFPDSLGLKGAFKKPVLTVDPEASASLLGIVGDGSPVICIGVGSDAKMARNNGLSTKSLPLEKMESVVALLNARGFATVQLGAAHEPPVKGVGHDLRGALSIRQSAAILKASVCFVGTEGGLVHLAYAVGTPSVVGFGPTPAAFFGYAGNVNLGTSECGNCWWTTREWMTRCISPSGGHECMEGIRPDSIVEAVQQLQQRAGEACYEIRIVREDASVVAHDGKLVLGRGEGDSDASGLEAGRGFAPLIRSAFSVVGDAKLVRLARRNMPHALKLQSPVLIDVEGSGDHLLKAYNAPRLIAAGGKMVFAKLGKGIATGLPVPEATRLAGELKSAFDCRGFRSKLVKSAKLPVSGSCLVVVTQAKR